MAGPTRPQIMSVTMSQPHTVVTGPPQNQAVAKEPVTPVGKDRMQNETPKLVSTAKTKPSGASGADAAACKASFCSCALHYAAGAKAERLWAPAGFAGPPAQLAARLQHVLRGARAPNAAQRAGRLLRCARRRQRPSRMREARPHAVTHC